MAVEKGLPGRAEIDIRLRRRGRFCTVGVKKAKRIQSGDVYQQDGWKEN